MSVADFKTVMKMADAIVRLVVFLQTAGKNVYMPVMDKNVWKMDCAKRRKNAASESVNMNANVFQKVMSCQNVVATKSVRSTVNVEDLEGAGIKCVTALLVEHILTVRGNVALESRDARGMGQWENVWMAFAIAPLVVSSLIVMSNASHSEILAQMGHTVSKEDASVHLVEHILTVMENVQKMEIVKVMPSAGTNTLVYVETGENIQIARTNASQTISVEDTDVVRIENVNAAMEEPSRENVALNVPCQVNANGCKNVKIMNVYVDMVVCLQTVNRNAQGPHNAQSFKNVKIMNVSVNMEVILLTARSINHAKI